MAKQNRTKKYVPAIHVKLDKGTTLQKILAHFVQGPDYVKLTSGQIEIKDRLIEAYNLSLKGYTNLQIGEILSQLHDYSFATGYNAAKSAKELFGDISDSSDKAERNLIYQFCLEVYRQAMDLRPPNLTEANRAIRNMSDVKLKQFDVGRPEVEDIQPTEVMMGNFIEELKTNIPDDLEQKINIIIGSDSIPTVNFENIDEANLVDD